MSAIGGFCGAERGAVGASAVGGAPAEVDLPLALEVFVLGVLADLGLLPPPLEVRAAYGIGVKVAGGGPLGGGA